jgi:hypothetical protein
MVWRKSGVVWERLQVSRILEDWERGTEKSKKNKFGKDFMFGNLYPFSVYWALWVTITMCWKERSAFQQKEKTSRKSWHLSCVPPSSPVLGIVLLAWSMLRKCSTTESYPQPWVAWKTWKGNAVQAAKITEWRQISQREGGQFAVGFWCHRAYIWPESSDNLFFYFGTSISIIIRKG